MSDDLPNAPSAHAVNILRLLRDHHNVLVSGPPATGKSRLLAEVAYWFAQPDGRTYSSTKSNPFPRGRSHATYLPSPGRSNRHIFQTTFHEGTKYRHFVQGLLPDPGGAPYSFRLINGTFLDAAQAADGPDSAALLSIDELNRGPAVTIFGDVIGVLESEKRKSATGEPTWTSQPIRLLTSDGAFASYFVSPDLYVVAAMNEADTSVQGLDVAFRRRFTPYRISPAPERARAHLGLASEHGHLPDTEPNPVQIAEALVRAWAELNRKVSLTKGQAYRLGHGIFFEAPEPDLNNENDVRSYAYTVFRRIEDHIAEVFYGETHLLASLLGAGKSASPYSVQEESIGGVLGSELVAKDGISEENVYQALYAILQE